jgi:hypothetical protein
MRNERKKCVEHTRDFLAKLDETKVANITINTITNNLAIALSLINKCIENFELLS